ncbi:pre-mRNA cleavage factor Im 25 kDa subunit 1-like [Gossypium australe]|uniref:Pre-mRNA cleavage factor Im 25 kDa subunit n=1 Tax=Gossypium australe TaxID=47621 RepID=A0A5B6UP74_9ROSI|nr:pre-mRNA cleavage factor Im 25 kDa subunit 1-like [Gossypium australe]
MGDDDEHNSSSDGGRKEVDIYPLSCYYFGSKEAIVFKDETVSDRITRMKSNYAAYGLRTSVEAVLLVELFKHPHLLLLQLNNSIFKLPDIDGLRRKLSNKLSPSRDGNETEWEVGECLGMWWRHDFETLLCPYLPPTVEKPKECTKLFLVRLPESRKFFVPENLKMLAVPLSQVHENHKVRGSNYKL